MTIKTHAIIGILYIILLAFVKIFEPIVGINNILIYKSLKPILFSILYVFLLLGFFKITSEPMDKLFYYLARVFVFGSILLLVEDALRNYFYSSYNDPLQYINHIVWGSISIVFGLSIIKFKSKMKMENFILGIIFILFGSVVLINISSVFFILLLYLKIVTIIIYFVRTYQFKYVNEIKTN